MCTVFAWENSKSGSVRGYVNPIFSHFCLFFQILCLFLKFSTFESCYIQFVPSLEYPSADDYCCCPGKVKIWVHLGVHKPFLSQFFLFSEIFLSFLQFFILESCYIWFKLSLQYPSEYVYIFALVKFKIWVYLGVCKPCFEPFCLFLRLCVFFFCFPHWNRVIFGL